MIRLLKAFWACFAGAYAISTQYRAEFLLYMLSGVTPLIMMFVWISIARTGAVDGHGGAWFAAYFLVAYGVRQFNPIWLTRELDSEVRLGRLSVQLMRPLNPYWRLLAWHVSDMAIRGPIVFLFIPLALWISGGYAELSFENAPFFVLAAVAGMLLHFHMEYLLGLSAFWTDQSLAFEGFYLTLFSLLGGLVVPINLFPEAVRDLILLTPFPYIFGFPAGIALGVPDSAALLRGFLIQGGWLLVLGSLGQILWRRGLRRYGAAGA
ncbi:multidrug ABC transporter permease [Hypericibacter adhaerens]|uniref:Multidrug ABC transporter permease n=1 Tax=Hypericibacter adhaerens TaxID=2602016 RepID=A0A5J6MWI1_9PROT|nr:ABC-2 family transporter protein [Hypericibacter adhaerens]QEX21829.1 multidrug ABC transporter permease [Hypericibacter adhaerens]